jgi:hypothetical protein
LAFLDEDDSFPPVATEPEEPPRTPPDRQRMFMLRRLGAVAVGILILILIVIGIRGCLNARTERAFENYARDLTTLTNESQQLSDTFFGRLEDPKNLTELQFETEIKADRSSAEGLVNRAEGLDPPGELDAAQDDVVAAFELRRDGLAAISDSIGGAFSNETDVQAESLDQITLHMQDFLAGDVLYRRGAEQINSVLRGEGIAEKVPESAFLPDPITDWLDETNVSEKLAGVTGTEETSSGLHGLGISQVLVGDVALSPDTATTVAADGTPELEVSVDNQGDSEETDIPVQVTVTGGDEPIEGEATINKVLPGETQTVKIPLEPAPPKDTEVSIEVFVQPVLGEQVADNNEFTYDVSFE